MEWIRENWLFIIFLIIFIAMHFTGQGCMGGHGTHGREKGEQHKGHGNDN